MNSLWWSRKKAGAEIDEAEIYERPLARHKLVHTHAGSGRKSLFIAAHTMDIEGMDKAEGRQLIEDLIAHTSRSETLYPGEFFGSGTVGGGCGLELERYLSDGDVMELEVEGIGILKNRIIRET